MNLPQEKCPPKVGFLPLFMLLKLSLHVLFSDTGQCDHSDCLTLITDNSGDNWVYPLAWMPYIQEKITFSIDGDHDVAMSLSKHTDPIAVRYLVSKYTETITIIGEEFMAAQRVTLQGANPVYYLIILTTPIATCSLVLCHSSIVALILTSELIRSS